MKPIVMTVRALRRMALSASQDRTRFHICAIKFRKADMAATDGTALVLVPLPEDVLRDFALPAHAALEATASWKRDAIVRITRKGKTTTLTTPGKDCVIGAEVPDGEDVPYPPVEQVIERYNLGGLADFLLGPRMLIRVGRVARDLGLHDPEAADQAPVRLVHTSKNLGPTHFTFATEHGDALVIAMPVRP